MKKRCWWSRLSTEGVAVNWAWVAVDAGDEDRILFGPDADARDVIVVVGANRSAT